MHHPPQKQQTAPHSFKPISNSLSLNAGMAQAAIGAPTVMSASLSTKLAKAGTNQTNSMLGSNPNNPFGFKTGPNAIQTPISPSGLTNPASQKGAPLFQETQNQPKEKIPFLTGAALHAAKLTEQLIDLISQETRLLKARKPRDAQQLHGEKNRVITEYREAISRLYQSQSILGAADSEIRLYMRQLTDRLRDTLRDHVRIVLRFKNIAEGLIRSVSEEVSKGQEPASGYNKAAGRPANTYRRPMSLSLNQLV